MKPGSEQLVDWLGRRGFSQREAADHFGMTETFMSLLIKRRRTPGLANAVKIERETGIPIEAWMSNELDRSDPESGANGRKRSKARE